MDYTFKITENGFTVEIETKIIKIKNKQRKKDKKNDLLETLALDIIKKIKKMNFTLIIVIILNYPLLS